VSDLLQAAQQRLADRLKALVGQPFTYTQAGVVSNGRVTGIIGRTAFRTSDARGVSRLEWDDADVLMEAADLVALGVAKPVKGDVITPTGTNPLNDGRAYEVQAPPGEQHYRPSDPYGILLRIHTKRVT